MKKLISAIITIAFFICPSVCLSSYLVELKNGSTFITNHYCKKKGRIKFYFRGGVVGIGKDIVLKIEDSDLPYQTEESQPAKKENAQPQDKLDIDYYKNKKFSLVARLKNQQKKLEPDISRGKERWIERNSYALVVWHICSRSRMILLKSKLT
jgi:hypothetical protein